jgi:hypothetical protein
MANSSFKQGMLPQNVLQLSFPNTCVMSAICKHVSKHWQKAICIYEINSGLVVKKKLKMSSSHQVK